MNKFRYIHFKKLENLGGFFGGSFLEQARLQIWKPK